MIMKPLILIFSYILGLIVQPFILAFTPRGSDKMRWLDGWFGNKADSIDGDRPYQNWASRHWLIKHFPRYWWSAIRNPSHNLAFKLGCNGLVTIMASTGELHKPGHYRAVATIDGKKYKFYYGVMKWPYVDRYFRYAIGPKLWNTVVFAGMRYKAVYALSVLPWISRRTAGVI